MGVFEELGVRRVTPSGLNVFWVLFGFQIQQRELVLWVADWYHVSATKNGP